MRTGRTILCVMLLPLLLMTAALAVPVAAQPSPELRSSVEPTVGTTGTRFHFFANGFYPDEAIAIWLIGPDQQAVEVYADDLGNANASGEATWSWTVPPDPQIGPWKMVALGINSAVQHVIPFEIRPTREVEQLAVPVEPFTSARFDLLIQSQTGDASVTRYGGGAMVPPDRAYIWLRNATTGQAREFVQVGPMLYLNAGSGWQATEGRLPLEFLTVHEQIAQLEAVASGILYLGIEPIRDVATRHYQLWFTGAQIASVGESTTLLDGRSLPANAVVKLDLWIGVADGRLYQQGNVVSIPARIVDEEPVPQTTIQTLLTYYDFDNPAITIAAPGS